jgi:hypothetical protein
MRVFNVAKLFAGSCVVYVVMAACSAYSGQPGDAPASSSGDPPPIASTGDPVPNALAEGFKSGSRLKLRFWEGSDGSRQFIDFFDTQLQTPCFVGGNKTSDGKTRCLPPMSGELYFSDAACTIPLAYAVDKALDPQPKVASVVGMSGVAEHYALGALMTPPSTAYSSREGFPGGESCAEAAIGATRNAYAVGAPLAPTAFVEMTTKRE